MLDVPTATGESVDTAELAAQLRVDAIRAGASAGSGHVTSSLSAADLMAVLLARHLHYDWQQPDAPGNDHLIFSKGHASPLLYAMFRAAGVIDSDELVDTYRRLGSRLQGHPTPELPWVDVATGSLGQGLPLGVGFAMADQYLEHRGSRMWVLCGDSEMSEGSMWEALDKAGQHCLAGLTAIIDVNRLGQRGPTPLEWDLEGYARRVEAFGVTPIVIDGHDLSAIDRAYDEAEAADRPTAIIAQTIKGRGATEIEDLNGWHGKALPDEMGQRVIDDLGGVREIVVAGPGPRETPHAATPSGDWQAPELPTYELGDETATRNAYGAALAAVGADPTVVAMDGEVSNSTHAADFTDAHPERYFEGYTAENQLFALAVAMSRRGFRPFASTFAAFVSRGYDFLRMGAISRANMVVCGSHAGVEIGEDGPSQMALEDIAALRVVHGSAVLYPADAASCARLVDVARQTPGIVYLRTTRGKYPVIYPPDERFPLGGSKTLRSSEYDDVTVVAAGVTVHSALSAADQLASDGIHARVIDAYSVKPIDVATLRAAVNNTGGRVITVEDHHPEGGLGSAVIDALTGSEPVAERRGGDDDGQPPLTVERLAVRIMPGSATGAEQLAEACIDSGAIVRAAHRLVGAASATQGT